MSATLLGASQQGSTPVSGPPPLLLSVAAAAVFPFDQVLVGMVAAGQGIQALCLFLGLTRSALDEHPELVGTACATLVGPHVIVQFLSVLPRRPTQGALVPVHFPTPARAAQQRSAFSQLSRPFPARATPGRGSCNHLYGTGEIADFLARYVLSRERVSSLADAQLPLDKSSGYGQARED